MAESEQMPGPWFERAEPLNSRSLTSPTEFMLASIAISLKRIADTLDGTAAGVCVTETIFGGPSHG